MNYLSLTALLILCFPVFGHGAASTTGLEKIGTGEAYYLRFIKVYQATLYADRSERADILSPAASKCLQLEYAVGVGRRDFIKAAETVLARQHSARQLAEIQHDLAQLHRSYQDVAEGDRYTLCYSGRSRQLTLSLNGTPRATIASPDLATAYFGIWLGAEDPLDESLRQDLLVGLSAP